MKRILGILLLTVICCINLTADLNEGLVAHYPFNGNANDESGNGNHGTVNGATLTTDRFGNDNSAYDFDGVNDFIEIQNSASLNLTAAFTLSAWINIDSNNGFSSIISKGGENQSGEPHVYFLRIRPQSYPGLSKFQTFFMDSDGVSDENEHWLISNIEWTINNWTHIVGIYNGEQLSIFVNGILDCESQNINETILTNNHNVEIGRRYGGSSTINHFDGKIDDIRIYNRALSEEEIEGLYTGFNADFTSHEIAYIGEQIQFIDTSVGNPTTWEWDFENDGIYDLTYYSYQDTIYWTYENTDVDSVKLKISNGTLVDSLTKAITVTYCPPAPPDSVLLTLNYPDVTISWTAVDTTICGSSITPDLYVIQYSETAEDSLFYYLSSVFHPINEFTHFRVLQYGNNGESSDHMFYKVIAIKDYNRKQIEYLESLNTSRKKVKWNEVKQKLKEKRGINFEN